MTETRRQEIRERMRGSQGLSISAVDEFHRHAPDDIADLLAALTEAEQQRDDYRCALERLVAATEAADNPRDMGVSSYEDPMVQARAVLAGTAAHMEK